MFLVVLLVLAVVLYLFNSKSQQEGAVHNPEEDVSTVDAGQGAALTSGKKVSGVTEGAVYDGFRAFDESIADTTRIAVDSSYTKVAFSNLTKLVVRHANSSEVADSPALDDLRSFSVLITSIAKTSGNNEGFKNFKTACDKIASVLGDIQAKDYPALEQEVTNLKQMAAQVKIATPMYEQQPEINSFLRKSKEILQAMGRD